MRKLVLLSVAAVASLLLAGGMACFPSQEEAQEQQNPTGQRQAATEQKEGKDAPEPAAEASAARERAVAGKTPTARNTPQTEAGAEQAVAAGAEQDTGYETAADDSGAFSVEIPSGWERLTGARSEVGANWSNFGGVSISSSITVTPDLYAWHNTGGVIGAYAVASSYLAQNYVDDELVVVGPNDLSAACELGVRRGFERGPYSGKVQE